MAKVAEDRLANAAAPESRSLSAPVVSCRRVSGCVGRESLVGTVLEVSVLVGCLDEVVNDALLLARVAGIAHDLELSLGPHLVQVPAASGQTRMHGTTRKRNMSRARELHARTHAITVACGCCLFVAAADHADLAGQTMSYRPGAEKRRGMECNRERKKRGTARAMSAASAVGALHGGAGAALLSLRSCASLCLLCVCVCVCVCLPADPARSFRGCP